MKPYKRTLWLLIILFVIFPLIYLAHWFLAPKPGTGEDLIPQTNLHFTLTEQKMDGDSLIVTVRNTGGSAWTEKDWIRAGIFIDGADTGIRALMDPGKTVKVGKTVTFEFPGIGPSLTDQYQIGQYQINSSSFFVRIPELLIGMLFVKYDMRNKIKKFLIFSGSAAWLVVLTRQWIHYMLLRVVICMCLFALLVFIGEQITSSRLKRECVQLGALTFPIFLVHHWLIDRMVIGFQLEGMPRRNVYFMFTIYILLTIILSQMLNYSKTKLLERIRFAS